MQERKIDTTLDVTTFADKIAPCLNIAVRFAGTEPFDTVTKQYNESMARILPQYGIEFSEIPRLEIKGEAVSASRVRKLAADGNWLEVKKLVSPKTLDFLKKFMRDKQTEKEQPC